MSNPSTLWTAHVQNKPEAKKTFEDQLRGGIPALTRLRDILLQELEKLENEEGTAEDFDTPSWALKQASRAGDKARIRWLLKHLSFIP